MPPVTSAAVNAALASVAERLGAEPDPSFVVRTQGAVSHVVGVRTTDRDYVLKLFTTADRSERSRRERRALELVSAYPGVPVPRLVLSGEVAGPLPVPYLVLTRLPGVRLADRRPGLSAAESTLAHRRVGRLLRRFHQESAPPRPEGFGGLLDTDRRWPTVAAAVGHRCEHLVRELRDSGGPAQLARDVERYVSGHADVLRTCRAAVLCHHDFIDGNLLVAATDEPVVTGVLDFDRAAYADPMEDLAQTLRNAAYHDEAGADELQAAYGVDDQERDRLAVHSLLLTLAERLWIDVDRPANWQPARDRLDEQLRQAVRESGRDRGRG